MKTKNKIKLLLFTFSLFLYSCSPTEPLNKAAITLRAEDASCTEAWLKLETQNINLPVSVSLLQNSIVGQTFSLSKEDTIIYVDSLLPNKTYTFQAISQSSIQVLRQPSNEVTVTTLDTTSHNFTWQKFTFGGEAGSSVLNDVAIINENNIWAVGEIYLKDSSGQPDPEPYAVAHWNGNSWQLMKLRFNCRLYYPNCGPDTILIARGHSIFARNENDIWIAAGSVHHFDGKNLSDEAGILGAGNANAIWGNENELWFVGNYGFIAHRSSDGKWTKIESGTDLQFLDIYGAVNNKTAQQEILAVCTRNLPLDRGIFRIEGNTAIEVSTFPIQWELFGLWFIPNRHYYVVGSGIYEKKFLSDSAWENGPLDITNYATTKITGNALNDIFVVGAFGEFLHFNGLRWQSFRNNTALSNGSYTSVAVKGNIVAAAGTNNASAVIIVGRR